jgi:Domain of unknown function (DUF4194)
MTIDDIQEPQVTPSTQNQSDQIEGDLSSLVITLLKGVLYRERNERFWSCLLTLQSRVRDYVAVLGLELILDEAEGYAFLKSKAESIDDADSKNLRLVSRRPLSFPVSLLLALLRKKLAEFDAAGGDSRLVLSREQIVELLRVFLPEGSNEAKLVDQIETHINKTIDLGFLRRLKAGTSSNTYEVQRILKAFVDAQWLAEFDSKLDAYRTQISGNKEEQDDA